MGYTIGDSNIYLYFFMMEMNYLAIFVATVLQFIWGAVWYMPLLGKLWGDIHGFNSQSPEAQAEIKKGMAPLLVTQFVITLVTTVVFAILASGLPVNWNLFGLAGFFWLGFVVPTQIAAVIFGGTRPGYVVKKILVMSGAALGCYMILAAVFQFMG